MTREERAMKLIELKADAELLVKEYNECIQSGKYDLAQKADAKITEKVNEYTGTIRDMVFDDCKCSPDPMLTGVTILRFTTIATKDEKQGEDKIPVRSIVEREKPIDLVRLHKHCDGIGANKEWKHVAQKMNFLLTAQKCKDLGIDPKAVNDSYLMSQTAKDFDMGKNPASNSNLLRTLQIVISAMLGDTYKATSHDVNYLVSIYSKKNNKALSLSCANHTHFISYIAEICHRIVVKKNYDVTYKTRKDV